MALTWPDNLALIGPLHGPTMVLNICYYEVFPVGPIDTEWEKVA